MRSFQSHGNYFYELELNQFFMKNKLYFYTLLFAGFLNMSSVSWAGSVDQSEAQSNFNGVYSPNADQTKRIQVQLIIDSTFASNQEGSSFLSTGGTLRTSVQSQASGLELVPSSNGNIQFTVNPDCFKRVAEKVKDNNDIKSIVFMGVCTDEISKGIITTCPNLSIFLNYNNKTSSESLNCSATLSAVAK